ncbi:methyltransferase [Streptomyces sp. NBC_01367]|uniref:methyltransferase n=1 Tax=Streptomyces sp. NBC_01367 TaxID=2903841 RepID=UPI003249189E
MTHPAPTVTKNSLLETLQAFKRTSLLKAAVELGLFDALADGPRNAHQVAEAIDGDARAVRILLGAITAIGLLDTDGARYSLPPGAADLLVSSSPQYAGHAIKVNTSEWEWQAMRDLAGVVRKGGTGLVPDATEEGFSYWTDFAAEGTFVTRAATAALLEDIDEWAGGRPDLRVLDIGCGHALFGLEVTRQHPQAELHGLDRAEVLVQAKAHAERMGLTARTTFLPGDAFTTPLDGPYDLIVVANVLPMFSEEQGTRLLRRLAGALKPGGRLVTVGFTVEDKHPVEEHAAHVLSLLMLVATPAGQAHSRAASRRMLTASGYREISIRRVDPLPVHVVTAELDRR